jgi:hypothetical protein
MNDRPGTQSTGGAIPTNQSQYNQLLAMTSQAFSGQTAVANPFGIVGTGASGFVWMGPSTGAKPGTKSPLPGFNYSNVAQPVPMQTAINQFEMLPSAQLAELGQIWAQRNPGRSVPSESSLKSLYTDLVTSAAAYNERTSQYINIFDVGRQQNARLAEAGLIKAAGGDAGVRVNLTNPTDAKMLVDNALQQYLGRDATKEEQAVFYKSLQAQERANPNVSNQAGTSGGLNQRQVAKEFAQSRPDYAEYTTDTKFRGYLMSAIMADPTQGMRSGL